MATKYHARLDAQIKDARINVAKSAIAHPGVYPVWSELARAVEQRKHWESEEARLRAKWRDLIADAPPEWRKLAPKEPS